MKVLFASSEVYPFIKTGGLADVSQSLPVALHDLNVDIRVIMPFYGSARLLDKGKTLAKFMVNDDEVAIIETCYPESGVPLLLVDCPRLFGREGNPYVDIDGNAWEDNAQRFALFCKVIAIVACNQANLMWQPDVIHCNDWQTGLALPMVRQHGISSGLVFTIHNIAYQGLFSYADFEKLGLPQEWWSIELLEFYGQVSFMKAGIVSANQVNTVSEKFAEEIKTPDYGFMMDGLLRSVSHKLCGIVNGVDLQLWSPENDKYLTKNYGKNNLKDKCDNKEDIQKYFNFDIDESVPLLVSISRLAEQKGIDLIIDVVTRLVNMNLQIIILGSGEKQLEEQLQNIALANSGKMSVVLGYDEKLAHKLTASADIFLMPSRFEPCGLNQMYSQLYGTVPIVRETGGLADTVINYNPLNDNSDQATGFVFSQSDAESFYKTIENALVIFSMKQIWKKLQLNGMNRDFSWKASAKKYLSMYQASLQD